MMLICEDLQINASCFKLLEPHATALEVAGLSVKKELLKGSQTGLNG